MKKTKVSLVILGVIGALYLKSHLDEFSATLSLPWPHTKFSSAALREALASRN